MKKIISLLLAVLIVISSFTCILLTTASAATNLWTDITKEDVKPFATYGEWKSFSADTGTLVLQTIRYQAVYVEMPALKANTTYQLSMSYSVSSDENQSGMRILNATQLETMKNTASYNFPTDTVATVFTSGASGSNESCIFTTGETTDYYMAIRCNQIATNGATLTLSGISLIEMPAHDISVENGTASVNGSTATKTPAGSTVTLTANPPTGMGFEKWEVVSGGITLADKNASTTTFTMPDAAVSVKAICKTNLWTDPTVGFTGAKAATTISYKSDNGYYEVAQPYWTAFSFQLPSGLSEEKTYRLSFEHRLRAGNTTDGKVRHMNLTKDSTVGSSTTVYGEKLLSSYAVSNEWEQIVYEFTGTADQLYLYMYMDYVDWARFRNFSLIELDSFAVSVDGGSASVKRAQEGETVTITADAPLGKQFKKWEVVSGGVTLENENASPTTFTMATKDVAVKAVFENCQNLWEGLDADNFLKLGGNPTFSVASGVVTENSPWYTKFRIDLPELEKNSVYRLSFDHKIVQDASKVGIEKPLAGVRLVTEAEFQQQLIDKDTVNNGVFNCNSHGKSISGARETTGDWESVISYEFDSGSNTTYYILVELKHVTTAQFRNFKLEKIATNIAPVFDANLGAVTPATELGQVGNEITFTAKPFKGNVFAGWYAADGETLLSNDTTFDYLVDDTFASPMAKFTAGSPAVENAGLENSSGMLVDVDDTTKEKIVYDPLYDMQSASGLSWQEIKIENNYARTGNKSLWIYTRYSFAGRTFKNLQKNTDYAISFWLYGAKNCQLSVASYVLPAGVDPIQDEKEVASDNALGKGKSITPDASWREVVVNFNSGDNTEVVLWINSTGSGDFLYVDDFAIYRPAVLDVITGLGGTVSSSDTGSLAIGTEVTLTATPYAGNNLKAWVDGTGAVLSTDTTFKVTVNSDMQITAVFDGYNKPGREVFSTRGEDGTFEDGTISGWHATNRNNGNPVTWCTWLRSTDIAYEGEYSLKTYTLFQNSVLPLTGLNTNTNYKFSFYVNYPEYEGMEDENHKGPDGEFVDSRALPFGILAADETQYGSNATIYASHPYSMPCGGGWYKVELYFNTGDASAVNFVYAYYGVTQKDPKAVVYFDNISLFEYVTLAEPENTDFAAGIAPWLGDGVAENGAMKLNETGDTAYQAISFGKQKQYTVSFRAKGEVFAAVTDVTAKSPSVLNTLSSKSYVETDSADWKEYSFTFYTGTHPDVNLMFASQNGIAYVDDIKITEAVTTVGALVEQIDFETERFALREENQTAYEIYTATGAGDDNVHGGSKSLHFKANAAGDVAALLDEAYLSYGVMANSNYRLTLYYKLDGDGTVYIAPNRTAYYSTIYAITEYGAYGKEAGYTYSGSGWNKVEFTFTAEQTHVVKTMISSILGETGCDFYIDDITMTVAPDLVTDPDPTDLFCEEFFNLIPNAGFEEAVGTDSWVGLPNNMKVVTDKAAADTGKRYLTVSAGQKYILPINLQAGEVYYFAASLRGDSKTAGRVALATQVDPGEVYFVDAEQDDAPASILLAGTDSKWKRSGFAFRANASGVTYLVIECIKGSMDIDTLSLCLEGFEYTIDPNRYEAPVKFDYDNIDSALLVYNGGFDAYEVEASPETGDSVAVLLIVLTTCLFAAVTLVFSRRKEVRA